MNQSDFYTKLSQKFHYLKSTSTQYLEPYEEGVHQGSFDATEQILEWFDLTELELDSHMLHRLLQIQREMNPAHMEVIFPDNPTHFWEKFVTCNRNILSFWSGLGPENRRHLLKYINGGVTL